MNKKGLIGVIILSVLGVLLVAGGGAGVYFYNYHVFKEVRVCVGNWEDTTYPCEVRDDCLDAVNFNYNILEEAPGFVQENFDNFLGSAVYCEGTCYMGQVRGIDYETGDFEGLAYCEDGEDEFVMEIHGKEGLEIMKWMKDMQN